MDINLAVQLMCNQPAEAYHVKQYLINCFVHPLIAALFTTWKQVKLLESNKYSLEEALYMQTGETFPRDYFKPSAASEEEF